MLAVRPVGAEGAAVSAGVVAEEIFEAVEKLPPASKATTL
jgi:hypothetical protein